MHSIFSNLADNPHAETTDLSVAGSCPHCANSVAYLGLKGFDDLATSHGKAGFRTCPTCKKLVVAFFKSSGQPSFFPVASLRLNYEGLPDGVKNALQEAATCHANECFTAAAIMIRKTLEELCADQAATGDDLKARIKNLGTKIVLPTALIEALDSLRLLGNDGAHIKAKTYNDVGKAEVDVAFELTQEIVKAVYQLKKLLADIKALQKDSEGTEGK